MKRSDIVRLGTLADALFEAEQAKLRGNRAEAARIEGGIADVRAARRERGEEKRGLAEPDAAQIASADLHWDRWTNERLRRLQSERARLEAEAEAMRAGARRAFGRREALDAIARKLADEARRSKDRSR